MFKTTYILYFGKPSLSYPIKNLNYKLQIENEKL